MLKHSIGTFKIDLKRRCYLPKPEHPCKVSIYIAYHGVKFTPFGNVCRPVRDERMESIIAAFFELIYRE